MRFTHLIFLLLFSYCADLNAQYFPSRQYMTGDGMPSNSVFDIAQHPSGVMWFVTRSGPVYYDAKEWTTFPDSLNLPTSAISRIVVQDSVVWVAGLNETAFTIQYYDGRWHPITVSFHKAMLSQRVPFNVIKSEGTPTILLGLDSELHFRTTEQNEWSKLNLPGLTINDIQYINGTCFIATTNGLYEFEDHTLKKISIDYQDLPNANILTVNSRKKTLHLLGYDWYAESSNGNINFVMDAGLNPSSRVTQSSIVIDQKGNVFYGANTPARIINHQAKTWQNLLIKGENVNIGSTSVFCDRENNIWVSDSRGLFKYNVLQFINYNKSSGLASDEVTAITQLDDGRVLLGNPAQFNIIKGNVITKIDLKKDESPVYRVLDIEEDRARGLVYIAENDAGLLVYRNTDFTKPYYTLSNDGIRVTSIEIINDKVYVSTNNGLYEVVDQKLQLILPQKGIRNLKHFGKRLLLLTNSNGILIYDGMKILKYTSQNFDLSSVYQAAIYRGDTILATRGGIGTLKNGRIVYWDALSLKTPIYGILVDSKDRLWIGGDHGVYLYDGIKLRLFDVDDGLSGTEINRNALFEDIDGSIWIGTEKGVSVFRENMEIDELINLKVEVTEVITRNGASLESFPKNTVPYSNNGIQVSYQCLSYVDEDEINFRYRIDSTRGGWIETSNARNDIVFSNLGYGTYQFEIQARMRDEAWGPTTQFIFRIEKPFYLRWWFILLNIVLLVALVRVVFYFRYLILIRQQQKLRSEVKKRTEEITKLNAELEEKVKLRTKELEDKNLRLEESAYVNAHYLRGPLSKIMSALIVAESQEDRLLDKDIIQIMKESVKELDAVIFSINDILKEE